MKKILIVLMAALMLLSGCGKKYAEKPEEDISNTYQEDTKNPSDDETEGLMINYEIQNDEEIIAENRRAVGAMLDSFGALDYEGALACVREEDRAMFDVESARSNIVYELLLSRMSYEFGDSLTAGDGGRYLRVSISSPSMLDIYAEIYLMMNDAMMNGEITTAEEARDFNNNAIAQIIDSESISRKTMDVDILLEADGDGVLRPALTPDLLNAMLGDIQNASREINDAVNEGVNEYNSAKAAGEFD